MTKTQHFEEQPTPPASPEPPAATQPFYVPQTPTSVPPSPHLSIPPSLPTSVPPPLFLQPLPLSALAAVLGCTRSTIRHFADRLGFRYPVRRLGPRHKRTACLTPDQAQTIATELAKEAATHEQPSSPSSSSSSSSPSEAP